MQYYMKANSFGIFSKGDLACISKTEIEAYILFNKKEITFVKI